MKNLYLVANYFLLQGWIENIDITPMKLQKLLYFAYGWYYVFSKEELFDIEIEAWQYGPVIRPLYFELRSFGNNKITAQLPIGMIDNKKYTGTDSLGADTIKFLEALWNEYKDFTPIQLSKITHEEGTAWDMVAKEINYNFAKHKRVYIPKELILESFKVTQDNG